jgi:hypothetical protein
LTAALPDVFFALGVWFVLSFPLFLGSFIVWRSGRGDDLGV